MTQTLQQAIIAELKVKPSINSEEEFRCRVDFLKNYLLGTGAKGYVLGISGGQDSALAGYLAQAAVAELREETGDNSYKFLALLLPYGEQKDAKDADYVADEFISADEIIRYDIKPAVDAVTAEYNAHLSVGHVGHLPGLADYHRGNVKARTRMTVQYAYAGQWNLLVVGCSHAAEIINGYETKGGDSQFDLTPLFGLNKRQGKKILRFLNAPKFLFTKAPTADLLDENPLQADEAELGATYDEIDDFLESQKISPEVAQKLEQRYIAMEHKRRPPITHYDVNDEGKLFSRAG